MASEKEPIVDSIDQADATAHADAAVEADATIQVDSNGQTGCVNLDETSILERGAIAAGTIIGGRYRILEKCGEGGMGVVYKVEQIFVGKQMALKTICAKELSEASLRRFQTEARAAFSVQHPNVVAVHDFGTLEDGTPFMAMDYVEGKTLAQMLRASPGLPIEQVIAIFTPACFGLAAAHDGGIVHRDLKPSNIMIVSGANLGEEGSVKILDFGIAKLTQSEAGQIQELTRTGEIFGSPLYMSPEQCQGGRVDQRSDIYSLGCVMFEMLTGVPPFTGESALPTMMQHLSQEAPSLKDGSLGKEFPPLLESIVAKMLAKDPNDRYQNLGVVAHELARLDKGSRVSIVTPGGASQERKEVRKVAGGKTLSTERVIVLCIVISVLSFWFGFFADGLGKTTTIAPGSEGEHGSVNETKFLNSRETNRDRHAVSFASIHDEEGGSEVVARLLRAPTESGLLQVQFETIDARSLRAIAESPWVTTLKLTHCQLDNDGFSAFRDNHRLEVLHLPDTNFDDVGAEHISHSDSITTVEADKTNVTERGIIRLARMKQLERLEVSRMKLSASTISLLARMPNLTTLRLKDIKGLTNKSISLLAGAHVNLLGIDRCHQIDDGVVEHLNAMPNLANLCLNGTMVSPEGIARLLEGRRIKSITVFNCPLFEREPGALERLRKQFPGATIDGEKENYD